MLLGIHSGKMELVDITQELGESLENATRSATTHFNKFLLHLNGAEPEQHPYRTFGEIQDREYFTKEVFRKFAYWMMHVQKLKSVETCHGYLSRMKSAVERAHDYNGWKGAAWYKDIRGKITNHYLAICKRDGTRLTNSAPPMTPNDLKFICAELLERNTRHAVSDRALLVWQWQSLGRISEVSNLTCGTLSVKNTEYISGCIRTTMTRAKTTDQHDIYVCLHARDFEVSFHPG